MNEDTFFQSDQITPADSDVEIVDFRAEPYSDRARVKINFRLSFFQTPPNAAIVLLGEKGEEIASVDLVNIIQPENELTLHTPKPLPSKGEYQLELTLFNLEERKARPDETGEVKLGTQKLSSKRITFTLQ
ncbi:MAG TPA: hypothetical protein ENG59_01115 [Chloroflexi bacterium]|nr:MAG: hypothetical protein DRI46_01165 [Chloroflexota bacterium]HDD54827.1 hypothetical protein [Chloroflexota bacterium]